VKSEKRLAIPSSFFPLHQTSEVFDVTGYEINPANIADRFQNQKVMVRSQNKDR